MVSECIAGQGKGLETLNKKKQHNYYTEFFKRFEFI